VPETLRMTAVPATGQAPSPHSTTARSPASSTRSCSSRHGFFTDAYDLFIIGIVVDLLKPQWHLSTGQVSLLNSATLAASASVGHLRPGRGHPRPEEDLRLRVLILASGPSPRRSPQLHLPARLTRRPRHRIGGTTGERHHHERVLGKRSRGRMVGLVFAMQGAGLVVGRSLPPYC